MSGDEKRFLSGCYVCGNTIAPFGFGYPGPRKDLPADMRGFIICTCAQHRDLGRARMDNLVALRAGTPSERRRKSPPPAPGQGGLDL